MIYQDLSESVQIRACKNLYKLLKERRPFYEDEYYSLEDCFEFLESDKDESIEFDSSGSILNEEDVLEIFYI